MKDMDQRLNNNVLQDHFIVVQGIAENMNGIIKYTIGKARI